MTGGEPVPQAHAWRKIRSSERIGEASGVQWLEPCLHCHAERRMHKQPNGQIRTLRADPACLPEHCFACAQK